jgi:uncharacterized protein (TIGR01244 family)
MRNSIASFAVAVLCFTACCSQPSTPAPAAPTASGPTLAALQETQVKNLALPQPGLVTAGQPTEAQFEQLAKLGVKRVIQLRVANEPGSGWEEAKAKALGVEFVRLPIAGAEGITVDNAKKLDAVLKAGGDQPTLLCCASSNRVGALLALKAFHVDGKTADEALAFGRAGGMKAAEPAVAKLLVK